MAKRKWKKGGKGQEKGGKGETRTCWTCGKTGHIAAGCREGNGKNLYAVDEDENENVEESVEEEDDLQAWCLLEESESEQWQEVISKRSKQRIKRANQASLIECGEQQKFGFKEGRGYEGQVGKSQSHNGLWSCRSRDA